MQSQYFAVKTNDSRDVIEALPQPFSNIRECLTEARKAYGKQGGAQIGNGRKAVVIQ